jgi:uroporphyrinogen-III synthase
MSNQWEIYNLSGGCRILVTKMLPGNRWLEVLEKAGYKVEVYPSTSLVAKAILIEK